MGISQKAHRTGLAMGVALLGFLFLPSCGGGGGSSSPAPAPGATAPSISAQPTNQTVALGQTATFSVTAGGTAPLAYQWRKGGATLPGATASSYTTPVTVASDHGSSFTVVVTNSAGSVTSSAATLTLTGLTAPTLTTQPANQSASVGQTATFTVAATGTAPLSYQWKRNGTDLPGATAASYTTGVLALADSGATFTVAVTNPVSTVLSSAATLTVSAALAPTITTQPLSRAVGAGQTATFTVVAGGTSPITYQWRRNGTNLVGATSASYTTAATTAGDNGAKFSVVVTNGVGSVTSTEATLTVGAASTLSASISPQQFVAITKSVTFSPTVSGGTAPYTYVWRKDGATLAGVTGSSHTLPFLALSDQGTYAVTIQDAAGASAVVATNLFVATTTDDLAVGLNPVGIAVSATQIFMTSPSTNSVTAFSRMNSSARVTVVIPGAPTGAALDTNGDLWVTLNATGQLARIDRNNTNSVTTIPVGGQPYGIARGQGGDIWFSLQGTDQIGRINISGGTPTLFKLSDGAKPGGVNVGADGTLWFTETGLSKVGRILPGGTRVDVWNCAHENAQPEQILISGTGLVYYSDKVSGAIVKFPVPPLDSSVLGQAVTVGNSSLDTPNGLAMDGNGNVWITHLGEGKVSRISASDGSRYTYVLPSSKCAPTSIAVAPDGAVYATLKQSNELAQIPENPLALEVKIQAVEPRRSLKGQVHPLTVQVTGAMDTRVSWEMLEPNSGCTVSQNGVFTAGQIPGVFHVIARSVEDPSKFGRLEVLVYPWARWPQGQVEILAGDVDGAGNLDGPTTQARFNWPMSIASGAGGVIYIADAGNACVRKIDASGNVTTLAGSPRQHGDADGLGTLARFRNLSSLVVDRSGRIFIADDVAHVIRVVAPNGFVSTFAGAPGVWGWVDGVGAEARFNSPVSLAIDAEDNLFVAESGSHVIRKITPAGVVTTVAGIPNVTGSANGPVSSATFYGPSGIAVGVDGTLFVADGGNQLIRKIQAGQVTTLAGVIGVEGHQDGAGSSALFGGPREMKVDASGNLFVAEWNNSVRKVGADGTVTTVGFTFNPRGLAIDSLNGDILLTSPWGTDIRRMNPVTGFTSTLSGWQPAAYNLDGPALNARFAYPRGIAAGPGGEVYVSTFNTFRKIGTDGLVSTLAGGVGYHADGVGSLAGFRKAEHFTLDGLGNAYIADTDSIRKLNLATQSLTTVAGIPGVLGWTPDGAAGSANFYYAGGIAYNPSGDLFIGEYNYIVRRMSGGQVSTWLGEPNQIGSVDGIGRNARFSSLDGQMCFLGTGALLIPDPRNHILRLAEVNGSVSTFAGSAHEFDQKDGPLFLARFARPLAVAVDALGRIFVADNQNNAIRVITPEGFVATLVGDRDAGISRSGSLRDGADLPLAGSSGSISVPMAIAALPDGSALFVLSNQGVMKISISW